MKMLVPFLHIAGVLLLFVSLGFEWVATAALSRSPTRRWAERWARRSLRSQIAAAAVILASGVAMAARLERVPPRMGERVARGVVAHRSARRNRQSISPPRRGASHWPALACFGRDPHGLGAWRLLPDGGEVRDC